MINHQREHMCHPGRTDSSSASHCANQVVEKLNKVNKQTNNGTCLKSKGKNTQNNKCTLS